MDEQAKQPRPFLRRNSGWQARVDAAREGRRYVPPGGTIKDYAKEAGGGPSLAKLLAAPKPGTATAKGSGRRRASVPPPSPPAHAAAADPTAAPANKAAQRAPRTGPQPANGSKPSGASKQVQAQPQHQRKQQQQAAMTAPPPAVASGWARRLLAAGPPAGPPPRLSALATLTSDEDAELAEFQALESQVLCEVGNTSSQPCSPARPAAKKPATGSAGVNHQAAAQDQEQLGLGGLLPASIAPAAAEQEDEEDVFQSDNEDSMARPCAADQLAAGMTRPVLHATAASPSRLPRPPPLPPACQLEAGGQEGGQLHVQSSLLSGTAGQSTTRLVQRLFRPAPAPVPHLASTMPACAVPPGEAEAMVEHMQMEMVRVQEERARVARLRMQLEEGAAKLAQEQATFERRQVKEAARFEAERAEELRKLQRDRRVLEKQSRAIMKIPSQREKEEVKAVEMLLEQEKKAGRAREARHKLQVERLRQQLVELQQRVSEQREEIAYLEKQRLEGWGRAPGSAQQQGSATAEVPAKDPTVALKAVAAGPRSPAKRPAAGRQVVVRREGNRDTNIAAPPSSRGGSKLTSAAPLQTGAAQERDGDSMKVQDVELGEEEVVEVDGCGASQAWEVGCGESNGDEAVAEHTTSPAALVAAHIAPEQPSSPNHEAQAVGFSKAATKPGNQATVARGACGAMTKAAAALDRFNQLRRSLQHHEAQQQQVAGRLGSLAPSPATAGATEESIGAAPAPASDDLRRLGRMLTASSSELQVMGHTNQYAGPSAPAASPAPTVLPGSAADALVSINQLPDGRTERLFASGLREQRFANGSLKRTLPDGRSLTRFANGDVKKVLPAAGVTEYWYSAVDSWEVAHASGVTVFIFGATGQVEAHHPGGVREVVFPDGAVRKVLPDGRELELSTAHLSEEIRAPHPVPDL